jgi:hypothetical protein
MNIFIFPKKYKARKFHKAKKMVGPSLVTRSAKLCFR